MGHRILAAPLVAAFLLVSTPGRLFALPRVKPQIPRPQVPRPAVPRPQVHPTPQVKPELEMKTMGGPQRTAPELKNNFTSHASKVQQQLQADPSHQTPPQSPWQWGIYEYLPSSPVTTVTRVENGNTLTVTRTVQLTQAIGLGGRHAHFGALRHFGSVPLLNTPVASQTVSGESVRVRLAGVAAPESGQALFDESTLHLTKLATGQSVRLVPVGLDADGAVVAQVFLSNSGAYLNERQIQDGMARNSVDDGLDLSLAGAEEKAQLAGVGLWKQKAANTP